jgi:hypothetical protein
MTEQTQQLVDWAEHAAALNYGKHSIAEGRKRDPYYALVAPESNPGRHYVGQHRHTRPLHTLSVATIINRVADQLDLRCCCAGQGGETDSAGCPIHDKTVVLTDTRWQRWYHARRLTQGRIARRLGWTR